MPHEMSVGRKPSSGIGAFGVNTYAEFGIFWGDEVFNYPPEKDAIIDQLLYENDVICISSAPKVGKSILAKQIMCCLTTGTPFLDTLRVHKKQNVLYVQTEGDRSETIQRLDAMRLGVSVDWSRVFHMNVHGMTLNTPDGYQTFCELASQPKVKYDVIIIDPLYTTVKGSLRNDDVATDWIRNVRDFKGNHGAAVIVINHDVKDMMDNKGKVIERGANQTFGSQMWLAFFNHNFRLRKVKDVHVLECGVQRSGKIIQKLEMKLLEPKPLMFVNDAINVNSRENKLLDLLKKHEFGVTIEMVIKETNMSKATAYRAVSDLNKDGLITKRDIDGTNHYVWKNK